MQHSISHGFKNALLFVLVNFHVPRLRLVDELGASVPFVRNHAMQVARVPCVHPLETWVQSIVIMWFRDSDGVSINRRWFVLNQPGWIVAVFKEGLHTLSRYFACERDHVTLKITCLYNLAFARERNLSLISGEMVGYIGGKDSDINSIEPCSLI